MAMATMEIIMDWFPLALIGPRDEPEGTTTPGLSSPGLNSPF
jgi:hypothetical protein